MTKKILKGKVVKNNRSKTITVQVERKYQHPVLKKVIKTKKKYHAHDEKNLLKVGDKVSIIETNPISKQKKFKVLEVIQ
jgi:small subunit ribosomal protein S17